MLHASGRYDADARTLHADASQSCPATPASRARSPSSSRCDGPGRPRGRACRCSWRRANCRTATPAVLTEAKKRSPSCVDEEPVPSLLRGFSAPVVLDMDYSDAQLLTCWRTTATLQPLGSRAAPGAASALSKHSCRRRPDSAGRAKRCHMSKPCAVCCATPRWTPPSRSWC
jgi:aminopeptidase N